MKIIKTNNFLKKLDQLDISHYKRIDKSLKKLSQKNMGNCSMIDTTNDFKIKRKLFELKVDFGPGYRVYFAYSGSNIECVHLGIKKTQRKDVVIAKKIINNS